MNSKNLYIFNSRLVTHVVFWVLYYLFFSVIWSTSHGLFYSFYLEFILLPIRIFAVYITLYLLLPNYLLKKRYFTFGLGYFLLIAVSAVLQRLFIYFFYDQLLLANTDTDFFSLKMLVRAGILINTSVFLLLSFKIFQLYLLEKAKNEKAIDSVLEIKADRRIHRVDTKDILFIEGKGNYSTYNLMDASKITAYGSLKKALEQLPENFIRVHKSYVVNKNEVRSFDSNSIQINDAFIPRGKSVADDLLVD
ncbi:LytR/AlgR family response regulator transcription factor [Cognatitamlana onchidii]|uniref:LytR/AlgR family response regulator transcription factor n=1 Tax=Cognatitamlana onchidii TaxID=2562860 RepID=UPI001455FC9C|nr:LytTR family DNA-binding domain-containing protein [Algibacter onchidii]